MNITQLVADSDPNRPRTMTREEFSTLTWDQWQKLLAQTPSEADVQSFLEQHITLIPSPRSIDAIDRRKGPLWNAIFTQPDLRGIGRYRPDFMCIGYHSSVASPVFIEIEAPGKYWFNLNGTPTADLTQAADQLARWRQWFSEPENELWFRRAYMDDPFLRHLTIIPHFVLIIGRASEFTHAGRHSDPHNLTKRRAQLQRTNETWMTYDRMDIDPALSDCFCATRRGENFSVVAIPPTFRTGPHLATTIPLFQNWEQTLRQMPDLQDTRRQYLINRITYWREKGSLLLANPIGSYAIRNGYE